MLGRLAYNEIQPWPAMAITTFCGKECSANSFNTFHHVTISSDSLTNLYPLFVSTSIINYSDSI